MSDPPEYDRPVNDRPENDRPENDRGSIAVRVAVSTTVVFAVVATASAVWRHAFSTVNVVVSLVLFAAGCGAFLAGYAIAVGRSRHDKVDLAGLFFLAGGVAPPGVRAMLRGCLAVQVIVALATASARPITSQAFVIMAPMFGLGTITLWTARHGTFTRHGDALEPPPDEPD